MQTQVNYHSFSMIAGMMAEKLKKAMNKVTSSCIPCAKSGRPANTRKLSLKYVNKDFNVEVKADFMTVRPGEGKYEILNIVDTSTGYGERSVVGSRSTETMMSKFEESWLCRHGAPEFFSGDPKFCQPFFVKYLGGNNKKVNERPDRSSHNDGRVERSNGVFKSVFEKISKEKTTADIYLLVVRASFVTKILFGRSKRNSFQLARDYMPGIEGLPSKILKQDLLDTYVKLSAYIAIKQVAKGRTLHHVPRSIIKQGDTIYVFFKPTNKFIDVEWITETVIDAKEHYVECRRHRKRRPLRVAFEHIRLVSSKERAKQIYESFMEEDIAETDRNGLKPIEKMTDSDEKDLYEDILGTETDNDDDEELRPIGTTNSMLY